MKSPVFNKTFYLDKKDMSWKVKSRLYKYFDWHDKYGYLEVGTIPSDKKIEQVKIGLVGNENRSIRGIDDLCALIVVKDRYGGTYSGSEYVAWYCAPEYFPQESIGDDGQCIMFWGRHYIDDPMPICGKGETIDESVEDLIKNINKFRERYPDRMDIL